MQVGGVYAYSYIGLRSSKVFRLAALYKLTLVCSSKIAWHFFLYERAKQQLS